MAPIQTATEEAWGTGRNGTVSPGRFKLAATEPGHRGRPQAAPRARIPAVLLAKVKGAGQKAIREVGRNQREPLTLPVRTADALSQLSSPGHATDASFFAPFLIFRSSQPFLMIA